MKCFLHLFLLLFILSTGCIRRQSPVVKLFAQHIGKTVSLEGYDSVYQKNIAYSFREFRERYPFITVNYVDEDCGVCKVKVREWCDNLDKIPQDENLAHLFVFRGKNHESFLRYSQGDNEFPFFIMPSEEFSYALNNSEIDRQIIDAGFLLDGNNRIRVIGDPFVSKKMSDMYYGVIEDPVK